MKRKLIFFFGLLCSVTAYTQEAIAPAAVMQYFNQNLKVYFINQPNAESLTINTINTSAIAANTNGFLFGTSTNNGMDMSATLLQSLFKDRNNGGDGSLQDFVYLLMKQRDKPVQIFFINDVQTALTPDAVTRISADTIRDNGLRVWPRVAQNVATDLAGSLLVGEKVLGAFNDPGQAKKMLVNLMTSIATKDFRSMHHWWVFSTPPASGTVWYYTYALMDTRVKTYQGICNAIVNVSNSGARDMAINWYTHQKASLIRWAPTPRDARGTEEVPNTYWLYNRIQSENLRNRINDLPLPQFSHGTRNRYRVFQFLSINGPARDFTHDRLFVRDEQVLGLLGDFFMRALNFRNYLNCLVYADNRLQTANPTDRLTIFIENLCLANTNGVTLQQLQTSPPAEKKYLLGLALFDYFSNFSSNGTASGFSDISGGTFSADLVRLYTPAIRQSVMDAVRQVRTTTSDEKEIFLGELNAVKQVLNIN